MSNTNWHSQWDPKKYQTHSTSQVTTAQQLIHSYLSLQGSEAILDIGCGTGQHTFFLAKQVPAGHVTGIDISKNMIQYAQKMHKANNLTFLVADGQEFNLEKKVDLVVSFACFTFIKNKATLFAHIKKALNPNGTLLFNIGVEDQPAYKASYAIQKSEKWAKHYQDYEHPYYFVQKEKLESLVNDAGLQIDWIKTEATATVFQNRSALEKHCEAIPLANHVPAELKKELIQDLVTAYLEIEPPQPDGSIIFAPKYFVVKAFNN